MLPIAAVIVITILGCAVGEIKIVDPKIIGGVTAKDHEFPYQVSMRRPNTLQHFCGGSIISPHWILSAAHCTRIFSPLEMVIVVGTNYLNNSDGASYKISQIIVHKKFDFETLINDIAVFRIKGKIKLGTEVATIDLTSDPPTVGLNVTLSGWGYINYRPNIIPRPLQYITLKTIDVTECERILHEEKPVTKNHVCTGAPVGQGACHGDSGGPLVYGSEQIGIVSWGTPCALGKPDVFTSVAAYRAWIRSKTHV